MSCKHQADRVDLLTKASLRLGAEPVDVSSASSLSLSIVELSSPPAGTFREHLAEEFDVLTRRVRQQREQADRLRLLANQLEIHRAPGIERLGSRTGLYRLRAVA
jgi:hypothetical protein